MTHVTIRCDRCGQPREWTETGGRIILATHECAPVCAAPGCRRLVLLADNDRCGLHQGAA